LLAQADRGLNFRHAVAKMQRDMIRLSGHSLDEMPIVLSGLRPGEKLYEELLVDSETTLPTSGPGCGSLV
jgi:FlaA1/EpsC-like NDP-sugar epimerase